MSQTASPCCSMRLRDCKATAFGCGSPVGDPWKTRCGKLRQAIPASSISGFSRSIGCSIYTAPPTCWSTCGLRGRLTREYFFPSKLLEYLATGVPVISTCPGHVAEEFGHLAYLLREETPEALTRAIRGVAALDPGDRAELGRRARKYMAAHKTWDAQVRRILDYLRESIR